MKSAFPIAPFRLPLCAAAAAIFVALGAAAQSVRVGDPAPNFTATDSRGQSESLSQFKGKYVVLEWHNNSCPFTKKHYTSGNMQNLQKEWTAKGVAWFTVLSTAPGNQGYMTPSAENDYLAQMHAVPTAALLDADGKLGHLYNAKTTPQMIVIDPKGTLIYDGAIDDKATPDPGDIQGANNYVSDALSAAMAGKPVNPSYTRPYGCSVKYPD